MMRTPVRKSDTAEYPIVTRAMLERARDMLSMDVGVYHSAMVSLPNVSFDAVQDMFATLYSVHGADPKYLFVSEADATYFSKSIMQALVKMRCQATQIVNQTTQRLVHVIALPDLPQGTVLCGFFSTTEMS